MANSKRKPVTKARKKTSLGAKLRSFVFKAIKYFLIVSIGSVVVFKFVPIPFTWTMLDQKMTSIGNGEDSEINYSWRSYSEISKEMPLAVVAAEDQLFPDHFDLEYGSMSIRKRSNLTLL